MSIFLNAPEENRFVKELLLQHLPPTSENETARIRLRYREDENDYGQETIVPFDFRIDPKERNLIRWYLEDYLLAPYSVFTERAKAIEERLPEIGVALFRAVFSTDEARELYGNIKNDLLHTHIRIDATSPEGVALPWELLRDPARGEHGDLIRHAHAFVRGDSTRSFPLAPPPTGTNLNILYVLCRPDDEDDVPFQAVARPLVGLFRDREDVHLEVLRPATYARLQQVLAEKPGFYHIVHFDGHGFLPNITPDAKGHFFGATGEEGTVYFDDGPRTGSELAVVLAAGRVPVILLNACRSAQTLPGATFPSVANQLLQGGIRAVVAMAYSVYVRTAERYMTRLYERLLSGDELAQAHKQAILFLRTDSRRETSRGDVSVQDWMIPKLFEASPVRLTQSRPAGTIKLSLPTAEETAASDEEASIPKPPVFGFIGRDTALLRLERQFQQHNVVLLRGMAGIGKTETASAFARWLADTGALQCPPFFFAFDKKTTMATVVDRIGKTFQPQLKQNNIEWEHIQEANTRRQLAVDVLRQIACFLIFDNFEQVAGFPVGTPSDWTQDEQNDLRDFLSDLRGGRSKVLATSRRPEPWLNLPGPDVTLAGLKLYEAEELAYAVLKKAGLTEKRIKELPQFAPLLRYLDGNPLAIQVILPELAHITPEKLLDDLKSGEAKLTGDDKELGRSRSLAGSLIYRLDHLDPGLRQRLSILGLFNGVVDADVLALMGKANDAPAILTGRTADIWRLDLDRAAEVGLLRTIGEGIYSMHPALPWFFHEGFEENFGSERAAFERVFAAAYVAYGNFLFGDFYYRNAATARALLRQEEPNLEQAIYYALKQQADEEGSVLTHFLGNLSLERRDLTGAEKWYRQSLDIEQRIGDEDGIAITLHQLGRIAQERRDLAEAEKWYRQSLDIKQRNGDEQGMAMTLGQLSFIAQERQDLTEAAKWNRQSLEIRQRNGDEQGEARALHQLGNLAYIREDFAEAEKWYRQSLDIKQRNGDEQGMAMTLGQLSFIAQKRRDFIEAEKWNRQALETFQRIGDEHNEAIALHQLGSLAYLREDFTQAEKWYRQSLDINQRTGNEQGMAMTVHQLGNIAQKRRDFAEAEKWYRQALETLQRIGDEQSAATTLLNFARLAEARGEEQAVVISFLERAEVCVSNADDPDAALEVQRAIAHVQAGKSLQDWFEE